MAEWIGLAGVFAGALIAFVGQYLLRRADRQERNDTFVLEQCVLIIALSEDYRNRVWEEQHQLATGVVSAWDLGAYRLAEARLRILSRDPALGAALQALHNTGGDLGKAWRLAPSDKDAVESALAAHRDAIERFADASSQMLRHQTALSLRRPSLEEDVAR